jgi:hypothetical protein
LALGSSCREETGAWPSVLECIPPGDDPTECCNAGVYRPIDPGYLAANPVSQLGERVAVAGFADMVTNLDLDACVCEGELCTCTSDLVIDAPACSGLPTRIRLGGSFGGQTVGCADASCWPLVLGLHYAVCGRWAQDPRTSLEPSLPEPLFWLELEATCELP